MLQIALVSFSTIALTFAASLMACSLMMRVNVVDEPDGGRKSQTRPIPRLGGVAMLIGGVLGVIATFLIVILTYSEDPVQHFQDLPSRLIRDTAGWAPAYGFALAAFIIGLWDDIWTANTKLKLVLFALACLAAAWAGLVPEALTSPWGELAAPSLLIAGTALWLLVFTNAANFMDGSNGLAIGCLAIMLGGLATIAGVTGAVQITFWWFPLIGAIIGFMVQNLRGHLYAGDAGSLGLGALFAGVAIASGLEVWTVATLALPFLIDVLLTLVWRTKHGRNLLDAHLDHAYQRLIASGWSHVETAVLYWGLSATAAVLAYIGARAGGAAPFAVFWTLTLAGSLLWIQHRRAAKRDNLID
ncbi:MAG: hypothetical protein AAF996_09430 [Pseudomonadota bacterium]